QCPEISRRRASQASELLETPVRQRRGLSLAIAKGERVGSHGLRVQVHGLRDPLFGAAAPSAGGLVELWHTRVPLVGRAGGPLAMGGERIDRRYTLAVHGDAPFSCRHGRTREEALHAAARAGGSGGK